MTVEQKEERNREFLIELLTNSARQEYEPEHVKAVYIEKEAVSRLEVSKTFRLFFLLEGEACLSGKQYGAHRVRAMEFVLLPPDSVVTCKSLKKGKYIVAHCIETAIAGNVEYFGRLKHVLKEPPPTHHFSLPIRDKLHKILSCFLAGVKGEFQYYPSVYDAVFVMLRLSYTHREMASMFYPMISR